MKYKLMRVFLAFILYGIGIYLIWPFFDARTLGGLFLIVWGVNVERGHK